MIADLGCYPYIQMYSDRSIQCVRIAQEEQMDIAVEDRYFTAFSSVISARLGAKHPCAVAAASAARDPRPKNVNNARSELNRLDPDIRSELDEELERWMHEDA